MNGFTSQDESGETLASLQIERDILASEVVRLGRVIADIRAHGEPVALIVAQALEASAQGKTAYLNQKF